MAHLIAVLLAFSLAGPVRPAETVAAPIPEAVHPLLLSDLTSSAHPFWRELSAQTDSISQLSSPADIESALTAASLQGPAARLAAAAIARVQTDPNDLKPLMSLHPDSDRAAELGSILERLPAPRDDPASPTHQLSQSARSEPALRLIFDGERFPGIGLSGVSIGRRGLEKDGTRLSVIGQGEFGVVYEHPAVPGAVAKAVALSAEATLFSLGVDEGKVAGQEERTARAYARADAGPRYLGRTLIDGNPVSAREKVYGETLQKIMRERRYGAEDHTLVLDLARRMAQGSVLSDDLRAANIMIGRTLLDPRRRAYVVDGGKLVKEGAPLTFEEVLDQNVVLMHKFIRDVGYVEYVKTFREILEQGLRMSAPMTRWGRFWRALGEAFSPHHIGP